MTPPWLIGRWVPAISFHPSHCLGEHGASPHLIERFRGGLLTGQFLFQLFQRHGRVLHVGSIQAIQDEIPQAGLQEMAELPSALVGPLQPAFFKNLILGKLLQEDLCLITQLRKGRDEENLKGAQY